MQVGIIDNSGYEHANRVYKGGECPALQSRDFKDPIKVVKRMKKTATIIGEMDNSDGTFESANRIYGHRGAAPTIPTACGGGHTPKVARKYAKPCAERKRQNGQTLEYRNDTVANCITSIQTDSMYIGRVEKMEEEKTVEDYLLTASDGDMYGVFKLSPRECLRLQNVRDSDIDKMMAINSNTRCYMQAGNSICVSVLVAIFSQLGIQNIPRWNDMTDEERYEIIKPGE